MAYTPHMINYIQYSLSDSTGAPISGEVLTAYPAGTTSNGTNATTDSNGLASFVIDPMAILSGSENGNKIARWYDIYDSGSNLLTPNVPVANWHWEIEKDMPDMDEQWSFNTLTDKYGDTLPTTIPYARFGHPPDMECERKAWTVYGEITTTTVRIRVSTVGGGTLPKKVRFQILGG